MTDAPGRIWAFHAPDIEQDNLGCTIVAGEKAMPFSTEYIRVDLSADHIDAQAATIKALVEALECIDSDLESRNFLENSSLRDTTRAAIAAAKETT